MLITNFASGELSPNLNGRVDIQQYYQGAAKIENFEIIPTGGIKRRPGTKRVAELAGDNRLIPFIIDKNLVFILELKPSAICVWYKNGAGNFVKYNQNDITAPWQYANEIKELHYAQNYDTIVFVHKNYRPYIMKFDGSTFSASVMDFDFSPDVELDDDFDQVMIHCGTGMPVKQTTTDGHGEFDYINSELQTVTKVYNPGINDFWCVKEGKLYKWNVSEWQPYGQDYEQEAGLFTSAQKYPSCVAFFNNRLFFASTEEKPQMVWGSAAPDNYGLKYNDFCTYKKFVTVNRVVKNADLHVFTCSIAQADIDTVNHTTILRNVTQDFSIDGVLAANANKYFVSSDVLPVGTKVLEVTSSTIKVDTDQVAVTYDSEHTVETNCVMSIQLWRTSETASAEDYEYMVVANNVTTADCSFFFELASDQNDAIKFLSSNRFLAVGTESSIWSIDAGISATSVNAVMQGRFGSDDIQGQAVETATVYFAQGKKGIREFYYDGQSMAFRTNNIALFADHILRESPAVDFDYMTNPYSRLIIVRQNGTVAEMLYDKTNGIMAWGRMKLSSGKVRNCAVTRGDDENDLVFFVVKDGDRYFLELLDYGSEMYLDGWKVYDTTTLSPADGYSEGAILFNKTKNITCPYDDIPEDFISSGNEVYIGYGFESYIKSMPVVAGELSQRKRIVKLFVRFLDSYMPTVKCTSLPDEKFTSVTELPYSGIAQVNYPGITDRDVCFELKAGDTEPVNILSVEAQLDR